MYIYVLLTAELEKLDAVVPAFNMALQRSLHKVKPNLKAKAAKRSMADGGKRRGNMKTNQTDPAAKVSCNRRCSN